ncbi:MAG: tetratricopeptide repeat protein, partial [Burkholderiaceae bacterium]
MLVLLSCLSLAACASVPVASPSPALFADHLFAKPSEPIHREDVFALSDEMRRYLAIEVAHASRGRGKQKGLIEALYKKSGLMLEYDSSLTRNAAQAFEARTGNCLSLVIMAGAFAKELGLKVEFQSALIDDAWSRSANIYLRSGHVNIALSDPFGGLMAGRSSERTTVDFLPPDELRMLRTRVISEQMVVAMYMNNRAAEALVQSKLDDAYWWAREAIAQDPGFFSAVNTLGVIYKHSGQHALAEQAFNHVLTREPTNVVAMGNLAHALAAAGRHDEASVLQKQLARLEPYPPFYFFNLGQQAMQQGDYKAARDLFVKEVRRGDYYHEFHFWLAVAHFKLGDVDKANKHLALAKDT